MDKLLTRNARTLNVLSYLVSFGIAFYLALQNNRVYFGLVVIVYLCAAVGGYTAKVLAK